MSGPAAPLDVLVRFAEEHPDRLIVVVGPTASGKTELAVRLAESIGGEIVSADSVQVYRGFDVGSGKPTVDERARAPHHLVDVVDPLEPMDASRWASLADAAIASVRERGRRPIVCGGTYLWVRALVDGLAPVPPADETIRARHRAIVAAEGRVALHAALAAVDEVAASRLHPNDVVRVSRALEVFELTGRTLSGEHERHGFRDARHAAALFAPGVSTEELARRIGERARAMLAAGWVEEVRELIARGFAGARAMASVGYAEVRAHVEGALPAEDLEGAIARKTRLFARRQRTWLRRAPVAWLAPPST